MRARSIVAETAAAPIAVSPAVIFSELRRRSVGQAGSDTVYTFENDTGPDDANHAQEGCYVFSHPSLPAKGRVDGPSLYDVTPDDFDAVGTPRAEGSERNAGWLNR